MQLSICITTRNRPQELNACLEALWSSTVQPCSVIVSDDSSNPEHQQQIEQVVKRYPGTRYIVGPRTGVCGNRNNAVNALTQGDLVAFVDDDICVEPDFIARALERYAQLSSQEHEPSELGKASRTILAGISRDQTGQEILPGKLTFRGYFCPTEAPEAVVIHAAVFPRAFFYEEQWDENIFFGYEDAELCLRALKRGYRIVRVPELQVTNICFEKGTLVLPSIGNLTEYEIYIEAARLYVGIKRYKHLFPDLAKLLLFIGVYFIHMSIYLLRRRSLNGLPEIVRRSHIQRLWQSSPVSPAT